MRIVMTGMFTGRREASPSGIIVPLPSSSIHPRVGARGSWQGDCPPFSGTQELAPGYCAVAIRLPALCLGDRVPFN